MNTYVGLKGIMDGVVYYTVHIPVSTIKDIIGTKESIVSGTNQLISLEKDNVMWSEVELEYEEESYFTSGLVIINDMSKFKINLSIDISEMSDEDRIPVNIYKGF